MKKRFGEAFYPTDFNTALSHAVNCSLISQNVTLQRSPHNAFSRQDKTKHETVNKHTGLMSPGNLTSHA